MPTNEKSEKGIRRKLEWWDDPEIVGMIIIILLIVLPLTFYMFYTNSL